MRAPNQSCQPTPGGRLAVVMALSAPRGRAHWLEQSGMKRLPLILLLLLYGCTKTVTKPGLDAKATEHAGFTFPDQSYYIGSESGYDYFVIRRGLGSSTHRYRVLQSEGAVTNRFNVTKDETRWRGYGVTGIVVTNGQAVLPK